MQNRPYRTTAASVKSPEPFYQIPESIFGLAASGTISLHEMLVWSVIFRDRFRGYGFCEKSHRRIALELHFAPSTVQASLKKLHRMRLLLPVPARTPRSTLRWRAQTPAESWDNQPPTAPPHGANCTA